MRYIIYDLEATCWMGRPPGGINEVIEIGALMLNDFGEDIGSFNKFIKPTVNPELSSFCKKLTSITQEQIDRSKTFPIVIEEFKDWIGVDSEDYILGSWGKFDREILKVNCALHRLEDDWLTNYINVKKQYRLLKNNPKYTGLKNSVEREGFEFTGVHHRAISDAENLAKIFRKYIDEWVL